MLSANICSVSGGLVTPECGSNYTTQWFLEGTQPTEMCSYHSGNSSASRNIALWRIKQERYQSGVKMKEKIDSTPLKLDLSFLTKTDYSDYDDEDLSSEEETSSTQDDVYTAGPDFNFLLY